MLDVGVGVCVVIIIKLPNSNSSRCNDIAAIDHTITSIVVVFSNSVVIIDPHNTNSGRFIAIAVVNCCCGSCS